MLENYQTVSRETVWKVSNYPTDGHTNCRNGAQKACSCTVVVPKTRSPEAPERLSRQFPETV